MASYQYRKSHCGDKTILRPSYLHNGISYTGKMTSIYWIRAEDTLWAFPAGHRFCVWPVCVSGVQGCHSAWSVLSPQCCLHCKSHSNTTTRSVSSMHLTQQRMDREQQNMAHTEKIGTNSARKSGKYAHCTAEHGLYSSGKYAHCTAENGLYSKKKLVKNISCIKYKFTECTMVPCKWYAAKIKKNEGLSRSWKIYEIQKNHNEYQLWSGYDESFW